MSELRKTSAEWQKEYPNPRVIDPDGWDRENYEYSWFKEEITKEEYDLRVMSSTCTFETN